MYRKIYRQEGGLAEEGYRAQISQARERAIEDWNRSNRGEVAERVRSRPSIWKNPEDQGSLAAIPLTFADVTSRALLNKYLPQSWISGDKKPSYIRTPEMDQQVLEAIMRQREGQGPGSGTLSYSDWGVRGSPETSYGGMGDMLYGVPGLANAMTLGTIDYDIDPVTDRITFPRGGIYDFEPGELRGSNIPILGPLQQKVADIYTKSLKEYSGDVSPRNLYYRPQVDEYGGLADLPEANRLRQPINPLDYQDEFNFRRNYLSDYIDPSKDSFRDTGELEGYTFIPEIATQYRGDPHPEHDPEIYKQYIKAHQQATKIWAQRNQQPQQQPTGFEGTGYGGLADLPGQKVYYTDSTGSILYPGYLGLDYGDFYFHPDFEKKYTESPYKTTRAEFDEAWNNRVNQSVPTQPTGFEGTGYGQFSPQLAGGVYTPTGDPGLRPAGTTPTNVNTRPYQPLAAY